MALLEERRKKDHKDLGEVSREEEALSEVDEIENELKKAERLSESVSSNQNAFDASVRELTEGLKEITEELRTKILEEKRRRNKTDESLSDKQRQKLREARNSDRSDAEELLEDYKNGEI